MNSHDMMHKMLQQLDLYINGQGSFDAVIKTMAHAEQVLDMEHRAMPAQLTHSHEIYGDVVEAEFYPLHDNGQNEIKH